jgi:hypothetical protein
MSKRANPISGLGSGGIIYPVPTIAEKVQASAQLF